MDAETFGETLIMWFLAGISLAIVLIVAGYLLLWATIFATHYSSKAWQRVTGRPGW